MPDTALRTSDAMPEVGDAVRLESGAVAVCTGIRDTPWGWRGWTLKPEGHYAACEFSCLTLRLRNLPILVRRGDRWVEIANAREEATHA